MGNVLGITVSGGIDYLAGSLTAMLWEWAFPDYKASSTSKFMNLIEGLLQLAATITTASYAVGLLTPSGFVKDRTTGMIGVMFFAFMYSVNMRAKLQSMHVTLRDVLLFNPGGFIDSKIKPYVKNHPDSAPVVSSTPSSSSSSSPSSS